MSSIEALLDFYVGTLFKEGERFARIKALSLSLEFLSGGRKILRVYFYSIIWCVIFTSSVFSVVLYEVMAYSNTGHLVADGFVLFALSIGILSLAIAIHLQRESLWLDAFKLQDRLAALETARTPTAGTASVGEVMNEQWLIALIDKVVKKTLDERSAGPPGPGNLPN